MPVDHRHVDDFHLLDFVVFIKLGTWQSSTDGIDSSSSGTRARR
ncbi:MAG TPA: hypothetical protein VFO05_13540 [Candidatus Limnocylindrales bacterium]|nr:hypothetical protein [Candidatus Limnocylindrales bacterium]